MVSRPTTLLLRFNVCFVDFRPSNLLLSLSLFQYFLKKLETLCHVVGRLFKLIDSSIMLQLQSRKRGYCVLRYL